MSNNDAPSKEYICDYCSRSFTRYYNLQTHIENCHLNSSCSCDICFQSFGSPAGLQQHLSRGHNRFGQGLPECDICGRIYARKQNIATHMLTTHLLCYRPEIRCNLCCKVFTTDRNLRRHVSMLHNPDFEYLTCDVCKKIFKGKHSLIAHIQTVHAPLKDLIKCQECDKIYTNKRNLKRHIEMSHQKKVEFKCPECPKSYTSKQSLKRHLQSLHSENHDNYSPALRPTLINGNITEQYNIFTSMDECIHNDSLQSVHKDIKIEDIKDHMVCEICRTAFTEEALLRKHIKDMHSFQDFYTYCKKILTQRSGHDQIKEVRKKWNCCELCSDVFSSTSELKYHIGSSHDREYTLSTCNVCFHRFFTKESMLEHKKVCLPPADANACSLCDKLFTDVTSLEFHKKVFHPQAHIVDSNITSTYAEESSESIFKCNHCERIYYAERSLRHHVKLKHSLDEEAECQMCSRVCSNKYYLASHMKIVHNNDNWSKCKYCGKQFKTKRNIRRHIEFTHLGQQRYKCIACETLFKEKRSLRKHVRIKHPNSNLFPQCHICKKRFESAKSCKIHLKLLHSFNMNTFPCGMCTVSFTSKEALDIHVSEKHLAENEIYKCEECNIIFEGQARYDRHKANRHADPTDVKWNDPEYPRCILCDKDFSSRKTLKRHIKNFHQDYDDEELGNLCLNRRVNVECPDCIKNFTDDYYFNIYEKLKDIPDSIVFKCEFCKSSYGCFEYIVLRQKQNFDISKSKHYLSELCTAEMSDESQRHSEEEGVRDPTGPVEAMHSVVSDTTVDVKVQSLDLVQYHIKVEPHSPNRSDNK